MLHIRDLNFYYGSSHVLKNINLAFEDPALVALLGHNGSAKSTLLKILGASYACKSGTIEYFGENALDKAGLIKPELRRFLGILFQNTSSDLLLSAHDNLLYFARLMGLASCDHEKLVNEALERAQLSARAFELVKKFSHGMRRRLEIYRSFMHRPKLIFLDEPTEGLDFQETARFWRFVKNYIKEEGALVIIATHRASELEHCDQIVMLSQGEKIAHSAPKDFLASLDFINIEVSLNQNYKNLWHAPNDILFKPCKDHPALLRAHIEAQELSNLLASKAFSTKAVQSVRWFRPEICDAYEIKTSNKNAHKF